MCGICGQYNFGTDAPVRRRDIEAMTKTISHRGPDDEGYYIEGPLGFGFRRLSIIDLSGGHQPMSDREESVWVIFNGEIYNFPELKKELEGYGHVFATKSDTEVIIHGYKQWGDEVLNRLNGMFGLAIWDVRRKRMLLARDAMGIKLLYYRVEDGRLYFGSEMRPIREAMEDKAEVDPTSLNLFLRYRYTPAPFTILKGVRKLAPGTKLTVQNGSHEVSRWYRFKPTPFAPAKSPSEAREELLELYKGAIRRQLISDVPVGLLLSGGMDSSLLLALMNLNGSSWPTYTVGYGSSFADDELSDAAETANTLRSNHTSVQITRSIFEENLPKIVASLEEPIATSSIVPMYFVCQRARQDVKVALVGQGPDELFGGYKRHLGVRYGALWAGLPNWMRGAISSTVAALPRNETLKRGVYSLAVPDRMRRYQHVLSLLPAGQVDELFQDGLLGPDSGDTILRCWEDLTDLMTSTDELGGLQFLELRSTLPDELLMYADKLSMAHGLELRVPYIDKEIVEYVERLPANLKVRNGSRKWLHRQVCRTYLPESVLKRPKRGFAVNAVDGWFRGAMDGKMAQTLLDRDSKIYQFLRPSVVSSLFQQHASGRHDNHKVLFSLVVFEEWLRTQEEPVAAVS
ncbi:MAG: asparagine synthase (glutamine-hydrolyzing) [Acidobacteria bacterium]|nr:MAG: asparagine synthase (glutamine-hydrolyzing) [Acidobacteriota bacterium]